MIPLPILLAISNLLKALDKLLRPYIEPMPNSYADRIYTKAFESLGNDVTPEDRVPDSVSCAETISEIILQAIPESNFPKLVSTREMYNYFTKSPSWKQVDLPHYADIVLSPTGLGNGSVEHGHVSICGKKDGPDGSPWLMSTDSRTGTFQANYTLLSWNRYYASKGGFPVLFFRYGIV